MDAPHLFMISPIYNQCRVCGKSRAHHEEAKVAGVDRHRFVPDQDHTTKCYECGEPSGNLDRHFPHVDTPHAFIQHKHFLNICGTCGRERNDYQYHLKDGHILSETTAPEDFKDKIAFSSGATSGGVHSPYAFMAWEGTKLTSLRYEYGNVKHEDGQNVLSLANWLKAFHARDLAFFQDRMSHAVDHLMFEMSGHRDKAPGGNLGAVGWCVDVMAYVAKYDPTFYDAITRLRPHPGPHPNNYVCVCPRCEAQRDYSPGLYSPNGGVSSSS